MKVSAALRNTVLHSAVLVAGAEGLDREISWVHIIDHPEIIPWVKPGQLLLSNGYSWPRDEEKQKQLVEALAERGLVGVVLSVPHFISHFPPASIEAAQRCNFPLLELPWEINFAQVTEEIHAHIIARQSRIIERSERIHRALTHVALTAKSLGDLAEALSGLLERAVSFTTADAERLVDSGRAQDLGRLREAIAQRAQEQRPLQEVRDSSTPVRFRANGEGSSPPQGLGCAIRLRDEVAGIVWVGGGHEPIEELDARATEHAAVVAALHLSHQRELAQQEARLGYAFVDTLLEGRFESSPMALERARLRGWDESASYRVCLVLLDEAVPLSSEGFRRREHWAQQLQRRLEGMRLHPLVSVSQNQISFLLPESVAPEALWDSMEHGACAMAASRVWQGAEGMARGAADVAGLLPSLRPGKLHRFDEMLFPRVLQGDDNARGMFLKRTIGTLQQQRRGDVLVDTLCALCDEGFQLVQTARRLEIHISTLRYRLDKVQDVLSYSLDDTEARLQLQVAVRLHRLAAT